MSSIAIEIDGLSKRYRISEGAFRYGRLSETLWRGMTRPFRGEREATAEPLVWALRDVSLTVPEGIALGIVGLNGAGKSTLLKTVSRITAPTSGTIRLRGRVGSLLEVGTGFHPELTGRENLYLNGAILGMRRREIARKFDEIVAFAGLERFMDTPVKRYSTGMYVRLAFAVAAHLDTEILVVDEVLAVGDVNFQRRCLGKMRDVASSGRTVLFVSHQLAAINRLCDRAILLDGGRLVADGTPNDIVAAYLRPDDDRHGVRSWNDGDRPGSGPVRIDRVALTVDGRPTTSLDIERPFEVEIDHEVLEQADGLRVGFQLQSADGTTVFMSLDRRGTESDGGPRPPGRYRSICRFPGSLLNEGPYSLFLHADQPGVAVHVAEPGVVAFDVVKTGGVAARDGVRWPGVILPDLPWEVESLGRAQVDT